MCLVGIALLLRAGLTISQETVSSRQKSAEGIVGEVNRRALPDLLGSEGPNGPWR